MADQDTTDSHKPHRSAHSGRKADKKDARKKRHSDDPASAKQRNPKAFAIQSATKAERRFRRTMDIKSKGYHVPSVDRTPARPPPAVVAIVGPPKVGKTTLLKCLVKNFTRQKLTSINGPVTLISGKKKRVTFIECSNDINNMIDIAKIADLVLLLIDAKSGFEMETFEFMNICQVHGMPRLMGVLTHLDLFSNKKTLQKTKTILKKRYRVEIPRGEKMFYLSGILHGEYLKNEVHNLGRFISVMKFEPSSWKKTHPYVFVDRMEDITEPELITKTSDCNRTVCLYGYARGGALKQNSMYHIPGCGDYLIRNIHFLPDPCPLPDKKKKRSLNEKERLIYAPMSGVGGIVYDKDAIYIEMKDNQAQDNLDNPSDKLISTMVSIQHPIDAKMKAASFQLFPEDRPFDDEDDTSSEEDEPNNDGFETDESEHMLDDVNDEEEDEESMTKERGKKRKVHFAAAADDDDEEEESAMSDEEDSAMSDEESGPEELQSGLHKPSTSKKSKLEHISEENCIPEIGQAKWKENLIKRAADDFYQRQKETHSLQKLVYGQRLLQESDGSDSEDEIGGLFRIAKHQKEIKSSISDNGFDSSKFETAVQRDWLNEKELDMIRDCFVTGKWDDNEDAETLLKKDDELYGDFEDLETGEVHKGKETKNDSDEESAKQSDSDDDKNPLSAEDKEKTDQDKRLAKKKKLKEQFNKQFDDSEGRAFHDDLKLEADAQGEMNKTEFESLDDDVRVQYEGFRPGLYLRLEVEEMPCVFVKNFNPSYPVILGSLLKGEDKMGYIQVRIKKHRWSPKILKTRDPLIISLGWRRFQTVPWYYIVDHNKRNRSLKYTPKHLHCMAAFWGPVTQQKSGIVGVQTVHQIGVNFRIAAVGSVTEVSPTTSIVKKLKLVGTPFEIFKKTAFIEGMFHSALEVSKYEGAAISTVSGLRGQIKKALSTPQGVFRATFEDKILQSDIVFLRTWVNVTVPKFCITVTSLLLPPEMKGKWQGARTLGKLRLDKGIPVPDKEDSKYTPIERKFRHFAPLVVPQKLQKALPFKHKLINKAKKERDPENDRIAVIREPKEREVAKVMNMLKSVHQMKMKKENKAMWLRARAHRKEKRQDEATHHKKVQEMKKRIMRRKPSKAPDM